MHGTFKNFAPFHTSSEHNFAGGLSADLRNSAFRVRKLIESSMIRLTVFRLKRILYVKLSGA